MIHIGNIMHADFFSLFLRRVVLTDKELKYMHMLLQDSQLELEFQDFQNVH